MHDIMISFDLAADHRLPRHPSGARGRDGGGREGGQGHRTALSIRAAGSLVAHIPEYGQSPYQDSGFQRV